MARKGIAPIRDNTSVAKIAIFSSLSFFFLVVVLEMSMIVDTTKGDS